MRPPGFRTRARAGEAAPRCPAEARLLTKAGWSSEPPVLLRGAPHAFARSSPPGPTLRRAGGPNLRPGGVVTACEAPTLARTRPSSRALQTYLERFSLHSGFRVAKRVEKGALSPTRDCRWGKGDRRCVRASAQTVERAAVPRVLGAVTRVSGLQFPYAPEPRC